MLWIRVVEYIQTCPLVDRHHPAITAALKGIEQEQKRIERDAKLRQKFAAAASHQNEALNHNNNNNNNNNNSNNNNKRTNSATMSTITTSTTTETPSRLIEPLQSQQQDKMAKQELEEDNDDHVMGVDDDDWHTVVIGNGPTSSDSITTRAEAAQQQQKHDTDSNPNNINDDNNTEVSSVTYFGQVLAQQVIQALGQYQVHVPSPLSALAVAFHAALVSPSLEFVCTGIPLTASKNSNSGFAAPIRPLPKNVFLPGKWDDNPNRIALRYRKEGLGSMILTITTTTTVVDSDKMDHDPSADAADTMVQVTWTPDSSVSINPKNVVVVPEPIYNMTFPLHDHLNLESWNRASQQSTVSVSPCLHFKALAMLLSRWAFCFDLGHCINNHDSHNMIRNETNNNNATTTTTTTSALSTGVANKNNNNTSSSASTAATSQPVFHQPLQEQPPPYRHPTQEFPPNPRFQGGGGELPPGIGRGYAIPTTLDEAFPGLLQSGQRGPFSDDLLPGGGTLPGFGGGGIGGGGGGNWMGPNHPAFGDLVNRPHGGGFLQPRYDGPLPPYLQQQQQQHEPGQGGGPPQRQRVPYNNEPNDDHLPPPDAFAPATTRPNQGGSGSSRSSSSNNNNRGTLHHYNNNMFM